MASQNSFRINTPPKSKFSLKQSYRFTCWLIAFLIFSALSGCYEVYQDTITSDMGVKIPLIEGTYNIPEGGTITVKSAYYRNDYIYSKTAQNGTVESGKFRAIWIKDNIYAVQARPDNEDAYYILFYHINENSFSETDPEHSDEMTAIAQKYNVKVEIDDEMGADSFSGTANSIVQFLHALNRISFK